MSTAFVQGKDRPTMPKPEVPEGFVKMKYHGNIESGGRTFKRPIPFASKHDHSDLPDLKVNADRTCLVTVEEAKYLQETCTGAFTLVEKKEE